MKELQIERLRDKEKKDEGIKWKEKGVECWFCRRGMARVMGGRRQKGKGEEEEGEEKKKKKEKRRFGNSLKIIEEFGFVAGETSEWIVLSKNLFKFYLFKIL